MTKDQKIKKLSIDPIFGILTRPALEIEIEENYKQFDCLFIDISSLHYLNYNFGYEKVNSLLFSVFDDLKTVTIGKNKIQVIGRWFSGDEILMIMTNPEKFLNKIRECFGKKDIKFRHEIFKKVTGIEDLKARIQLLTY